MKGRMRPLFQQDRMAAWAALFGVDALLGPERRKTGWMRAVKSRREKAMAMSLDAAAEAFREAIREAVKRYSLWYLIQGVLLMSPDFSRSSIPSFRRRR